MKKNIKLLFSLLLIVGLIGAAPIVLDRSKIEESNNVYQLIVDDSSISKIKDNEEKELFYKNLKKNNISTITFNNVSIKDLANYRHLKYMTVGTYLEDKEDFDYKTKGVIPKYASKTDIIVMASKSDFSEDEINIFKEFFDGHEVIEEKDDIIFYIDESMEISYKGEKIPNPLIVGKFFIDKSRMKEVSEAGLVPMVSIINPGNSDMQEILFKQIMNLNKEFNVNKIQNKGTSIFGYPKNTNKFLDEFKKKDISIITTEFETNIGLNAYLKDGKENLIRGHEIDVLRLNLSNDEFAARVVRAVKERNMRAIIISDFIDYKDNSTISKSINTIINNLKEAQVQLQKGFRAGIAQGYPIMDKHKVADMFVALGVASITGLVVLSVFERSKKVSLLSIIGFSIVFLSTIVVSKMQISVGIKLYGLYIAIMGACAAIIVPYKARIKSITCNYILTSLLAVVSGLLVSSVMYGTEYILKLKSFSGVKILYILPPVLIALWLIIESDVFKNIKNNKNNIKDIKFDKNNIINMIKNIKWYHILIAIVVILGAYIYITRSGNSGSASSLELKIRRTLEDILYVRPRTKEFILGYPAILIAYYMKNNKIKYSSYMLVPAAIATMSTVNTFTHLHTPIIYSLLRTAYGIIFGAIIGLIYIAIFNKIRMLINKER